MLGTLLFSALSERPDRVAIAHRGMSLTFGELASAADRLAEAMALQPGERVAVVAPNAPALVVALLACWQAGALAVPLSARLRHFELARAFADAEPAVALSTPAHAGFALTDELQELARQTPTLRAHAVVDERGQIIQASRTEASDQPQASPGELAAILYTSGTTGEPKGALVPHRLAEAMAHNLQDLLGADAARPFALAVPASHAFGLGCLLCGLAAGATAVLIEVTNTIDPLVQALRGHDVAVLHGTPSLFARLLRSGGPIQIQSGFVAGSLCPPELLEAFDEREARILNLYGMSEIGAAVSCRAEDSPAVRYHTVGRSLPGYELRVAPGAGTMAAGEIQVRSGHLPSGYHGRPWGHEELTDDGWFRTGDLGKLDPQGNLTIAGRAKEVIHVGGFNVFPAEVEAFLVTHPVIAQAAVIGAPHPVLGEATQAFVVPVEDASLQPREVISFARAGIAGYKVPYTVRVVDELPLLPSGKPDRRALEGLTAREGVTP